MSKVDIIIPTRNAPEVLSLCLSHYWLNVHDEQFVSSVTMFDNCSTAAGMKAIQQEARRRGAHVFINERNIGVWASINRGLVLSQSEYVLVLTSDVLLGSAVLETLVKTLDMYPSLAIVGPALSDGLSSLPWLYESGYDESVREVEVDISTYDGACWLMRRNLIEQIGYFDPQFYVCYGDTDYMLRVRDAKWQHAVLRNVRCIHLDKQSRQRDHTIDQDNEVEIRDAERFRDKWKSRPEVLTRHPIPDRLMYALQKEQYWSRQLVGV